MPYETLDSWETCQTGLDSKTLEAFGRAIPEWDGTLGGLSQPIFACAIPIPSWEDNNTQGYLLWTPDVVNQAQARADWNRPFSELAAHPFYTCGPDGTLKDEVDLARIFLKICADNGLGILFTW